MSYIAFAQEMMPEGWEVKNVSVLICPCGYDIEWDGECPDGCVSPLREHGLT